MHNKQENNILHNIKSHGIQVAPLGEECNASEQIGRAPRNVAFTPNGIHQRNLRPLSLSQCSMLVQKCVHELDTSIVCG